MARVEVRGGEKVRANLAALALIIPDVAAGALYEEGETIIAESKDLVPFDDGALEGSAFVEQPKTAGGDLSVTIGYGGVAAPYAIAVHETPSAHDPPSWKGVNVQFHGKGKPKFLERPFLQHAKTLPLNVLMRLRSRLGM